jgi:hypothetical protein
MRTQLNNGREYELEEQYGLPEKLPQGEKIVWQGSPNVWKVAKNIFYIRPIVAYFVFLILYRIYDCITLDYTAKAVVASGLWMTALSIACIGMVYSLAYYSATTTVYTITNRRVVMRIGIALTKTFNLPFKTITSADVHQEKDGCGDIPLKIVMDTKIAYVHLWPHTRPGVYNHPQPMLRCLANVGEVSRILTNAWCTENKVLPHQVTQEVTAEGTNLSPVNLGPGLAKDLSLT